MKVWGKGKGVRWEGSGRGLLEEGLGGGRVRDQPSAKRWSMFERGGERTGAPVMAKRELR